ncbi:hypothetical protein [Microbacterium sp. SLBN-111]|uniref:hypothetical protein n=1 Tax=Microbacterium sp. SLBN-111 TaxID=3377733 RepID=UPI003C726BE4
MRKKKLDALIQRLSGEGSTAEVRAARTEAKWRAPSHPELRRTLAEHYRRLGDPAQAGRWGLVFPGWAKPHEVARLRWFLLANADGGGFVRRYLELGWREPVPPELADLVPPAHVDSGPKPDAPSFAVGCGGAALVVGGIGAMFIAAVRFVGQALIAGSVDESLLDVLVPGLFGLAGAIALVPAFRKRSKDERAAARRFTIERALTLLDERPDEGRVMLQSLARTTDDASVRAALVTDARRNGRPADAGRWGCTEDGVTTPAERDAFATMILRRPSTNVIERTLTLSGAAWSIDPGSGDLADVLRRVGATLPSPVPPVAPDIPPRLRWWFAPLLVLPVGAVGISLLPASAHPIAAGTLAVMATSWAVIAFVAGVARERPRGHRIGYMVCALVMAAVATGLAFAAT